MKGLPLLALAAALAQCTPSIAAVATAKGNAQETCAGRRGTVMLQTGQTTSKQAPPETEAAGAGSPAPARAPPGAPGPRPMQAAAPLGAPNRSAAALELPARRQPAPPATGGDRVAVVSNAAHKKNLTWLSGLVAEEVGFSSPRHIGESLPWLQWVVVNYDTLPDVVLFLHGDQQSWHHTAPMDVELLKTYVPDDVRMLSDEVCVWTTKLPRRIPKELPMLDVVYGAFWGMSFLQAFQHFRMATTFVCCSESMVSRAAIRRFGRQVYQQLVEFIGEHYTEPWGWVMERTWQNLFRAPHCRSDEQIIASLKARANSGSSLLQTNAATVHAILVAADGCCHPMGPPTYEGTPFAARPGA